MVLEQRHCRLGPAHCVALILLAFFCQSYGQPILRNFWDTNDWQGINTNELVLTNKFLQIRRAPNNANALIFPMEQTIYGFYAYSNANPDHAILFFPGEAIEPFDNGPAITDLGSANAFFKFRDLWLDRSASIAGTASVTRVEATNAFRIDPSTSFQDNEYITEAHLESVIANLAGNSYFLWTNAHPTVAGTRMAADVTTTEQFLTNVLANGSNFVANWLSTNFVQGGIIKAGPYNLHIHGFKTQDAPLVSLGWDLIRTNGSGIVTLGTGDSTSGIFSTDSSYNLHVHLNSDIMVSTNDFIGARFYVTKTGGGVNWITHVGGTTDSQLETPSLNVTANVVSQNGGTATNLTIQGFTTITSTTNSTELPPTNQITLGNYNLAGFGIPYWKTDSSNLFFTEPSSLAHSTHWVGPGTAAPTVLNCGSVQSAGTVWSTGSLANQDAERFGFVIGYNTTATSNNTAQINPQIVCAAGTRRGFNGYLLAMRWGVTNGVIEKGGGGIGFFAGVMVGSGSVATLFNTTNATLERMGFQVYGQMGFTNIVWTSQNTAGSESRVDTTLSLYPSNTYVTYIYVPPQGRTVGWRIENLDRQEYTNSFETANVSTNVCLPAIAIVNRTNRVHGFFFNWVHAITSLAY